MEPINLSLQTFMKVAASTTRGKISTIRTFMKPGGYDFYKVMKKLAGKLARGEISWADAEIEIAKIKQLPERQHTYELLKKFHAWFFAGGFVWAAPAKGVFISASKLVEVRAHPEVGFENSSGGTTSLALWNMTKPKLTASLAADGIQCLINELHLGAKDEAGILQVRTKGIFDRSLVTPGSAARLKFHLKIVEEIWIELHKPGKSTEELVSHIVSLGTLPPP
jgi:hypothetical protein